MPQGAPFFATVIWPCALPVPAKVDDMCTTHESGSQPLLIAAVAEHCEERCGSSHFCFHTRDPYSNTNAPPLKANAPDLAVHWT